VDLRCYLQPEPLLQDPDFVAAMAGEGRSTPAYAYAFNNPVMYWDEDGLYPMFSDSWNDCYQACLDRTGAKDWIYLTPFAPIVPKFRNPTMGGSPSPVTTPASKFVQATGGRTGPFGGLRSVSRVVSRFVFPAVAAVSALKTGLCMSECSKQKSVCDP
jgi:hypothetical protein